MMRGLRPLFHRTALALASAVLFLSLPGEGTAASLRWEVPSGDPTQARVLVQDLEEATLHWMEQHPQAWASLLHVHVHGGAASIPSVPMAGRYLMDGNQLTFRPAFPLQPGLTYRAVLAPPEGTSSGRLTRLLAVPAAPPAVDATRVVALYPSYPEVPENLLKFYLHFSAPMSGGGIYQHIHLREAGSGREVELPFLEIDEELWDPGMKRLTLFIDPGRIKRGVRPLEEVGPSLEAGHSFDLVIEASWKDAQSRDLEAPFVHRFRVVPPDREAPQPETWELKVPAAGTLEPFQVGFGEPMDHALCLRLLEVVASGGRPIPGRAQMQEHDQAWVFTPLQPWKAGPHHLLIPTILEDLAGNNIGKPFEVDLFDRVDPSLRQKVVQRGFVVQ